MADFQFIKDIDKTSKTKTVSEGNKIEYQEYTLTVLKEDVTVHIPIRECDNFEKRISEVNLLTKYKLKKILTDSRGFIHK